MTEKNIRAPRGFQDEPGRAARMAMKRVERSTHAAWLVNVDSRIPVRWQLFFIRLWLAVRGWFV